MNRDGVRQGKPPGCALRSLSLAVTGPNYAPQSIFKHEGGRDLAKHHRQFVSHCLEHVERSTDKALIKVWRDDSELARTSVPTQRAIETRPPTCEYPDINLKSRRNSMAYSVYSIVVSPGAAV